MNLVLVPWLVVGELGRGPEWLGTAQMCQTLPALLLVLVGGLAADRLDRRRLLMVLHLAAALVAAGMALAVTAGALGLATLVLYTLTWGTIQAFAQPARDAVLSDVAGRDLMQAVTGATLVQFLASAIGSRVAGLAAELGTAAGLGLLAAVLLAGVLPVWRLAAPPSKVPPAEGGMTIAALRGGLLEVWHSERLRPVAILVACNGLLFMGPFFVLFPLIVRDVYGGGVDELSLVLMTLPLGTITGSSVSLLRGGIRRKGRAFLLALLGVALCLVGVSAGLPFWAFVTVAFAWGLFHSLFFNASRTLFQQDASRTHRARVLSIHSLGFLGMAPISNLAAGFVGRLLGPLVGCALAGSAMIVVVAFAWALTNVRRAE